jgi:hypothetical protein
MATARYFSKRLKFKFAWYMIRVLHAPELEAAVKIAAIMLMRSRFLPKKSPCWKNKSEVRGHQLKFVSRRLSNLLLTEADMKKNPPN